MSGIITVYMKGIPSTHHVKTYVSRVFNNLIKFFGLGLRGEL